MFVTEGLVEQHIHGCFGVDFMNCSQEELLETAKHLSYCGVTAFFPTIMTDDIEKIKDRISVVKSAMNIQSDKAAKIAGIHLEGPFINPEKAGIHQKEYIQNLDIDIYKKIEDDAIKIVTIAPELDCSGKFIQYLKSKCIKISAGHTLASDLSNVNQVTHLYNAMGTFNHRTPSTTVSALSDDDILIEIIADSKHVSDDVLKITFKQKNISKVLLISDALPLAHSSKNKQMFAGQQIFNKNGNLVNAEGTMAGSSMLLCDIVKNLTDKKILTIQDAIKASSTNQLKYHNLQNNLKVYWNKNNSVEKVEFISVY